MSWLHFDKLLRSAPMPYLRGMDFPSQMAQLRPLLHVRMFMGNLCNLHCNYCFTDSFSTVRGADHGSVISGDEHGDDLLPMAERLKILYFLKENFNTQTVLINGKGEPTLEPELDELIRGLRVLDLTPVLATNGTSLDAPTGYNWQYMYDNGVSLLLKMNMRGNAAGEATIYGVKPDDHRYRQMYNITNTDAGMEWVRRFAARRAIAFNCVLMRPTMGENGAPAVLRFCRENSIIPWFDWYVPSGRGQRLALTPLQQMELAQTLSQIDAEYGYEYEWTDGMNLGCTPEMNRNFYQITDHGRILCTPDIGLRPLAGLKRYGYQCRDCDAFDFCLDRTICDLQMRARRFR